MPWIAQVLPSSIPFRCAYLFNILQLFFVTVLVINDTRLSRVDTLAALKIRPQGNIESSIGCIAGKVLAFTMVNVVALLFCGLLNLLFYPRVFNIGYYLFYWLTLNLPTLFFCLGLSTLVVRLVKNNGLSIVVLVLTLGMFTLPGSVWLNGAFDPLAARIPNLFSDFTGHVNLGAYLSQRVFILFFGVGLSVLAVIPYPRIHNNARAANRLALAALFPLLLAGSFAGVYIYDFQSVSGKRETFRVVYSKYTSSKMLKITENRLQVKEAKHGGISVTSEMTVENREVELLPLVFYLNPWLEVSSVTVDGEAAVFRREEQALLVDGKVVPGEKKNVVVNYKGKIDNRFCFLDTPEDKYGASNLNTIDMYRFGYSPAFCEKEYKLLTPECVWYPVSVPPYDSLGSRRSMFTCYTLEVEHDPRLVAICQGEANRDVAGKTIFTFGHNMKGISLCVGNYKKREIVVGHEMGSSLNIIDLSGDGLTLLEPKKDEHPTKIELFYLPGHEFMLDVYDRISREELAGLIDDAKFSIGFYGNHRDDVSKDRKDEKVFDPTSRYPFSWVTLVEVPCNFYAFTGKIRQMGERVQEGMVLLAEKRCTENISFRDEVQTRLHNDLNLFGKGSYDLSAFVRGNTSFISSDTCPLVNDALFLALNSDLTFFLGKEYIEYDIVDYLKDHSLEEALTDPSLSPELLDCIIRKKCEELNALLEIRMGQKEFYDAYHDFLKQYLFEEATFEDFSREVFDRYHIRLDSMIDSWYRCKELPVFELEGNIIGIINEGGEYDYIYDFKVLNRGAVPGIIYSGSDHPGWIIPAGEGRAIRVQIPRVFNDMIYFPLSLNVPGKVRLQRKTIDKSKGINVDTISCFLPLDATFSFAKEKENEDEIIVDNEDPGFSIHETRKFNMASLFGQVEIRAKCYRDAPADHWGLMVARECMGFPVQGAYFKQGDKGNQKVQWETDLSEGRYEVFCYQPYDERSRFRPELVEREYYYTVFDGKEEHEVVLLMNKDDWNWVSLGVFHFHGKGRVTLSDRDRKHGFSGGNDSPQDVVADAVKWVRVR